MTRRVHFLELSSSRLVWSLSKRQDVSISPLIWANGRQSERNIGFYDKYRLKWPVRAFKQSFCPSNFTQQPPNLPFRVQTSSNFVFFWNPTQRKAPKNLSVPALFSLHVTCTTSCICGTERNAHAYRSSLTRTSVGLPDPFTFFLPFKTVIKTDRNAFYLSQSFGLCHGVIMPST